jgi:uncharacterized membrane protein YqaE (UPF0057 family)
MKKLSLLVTAAFCVAIGLNSCSVEKRLYRQGLTVDWNSGIKKSKQAVEEVEESEIASNSVQSVSKSEVVTSISLNDEVSINNEFSTETVSTTESTEYTPSYTENSANTEENVSETNVINQDKVNVSQNKKKETSKVITKNNHKKSVKSTSSGSMSDDDLIGIILCLVGLAPFGVMVAKGKRSSEFKTNLLLWLGGFACIILGVILAIGGLYIGAIFSYLAYILLLSSFIHGLLSILR